MKEKIKSKLMGEIDIEISMKKINKNWENIRKAVENQWKYHYKKFDFFVFIIKDEKSKVNFDATKIKHSIDIVKLDIVKNTQIKDCKNKRKLNVENYLMKKKYKIS